jgi:hypothetical protein
VSVFKKWGMLADFVALLRPLSRGRAAYRRPQAYPREEIRRRGRDQRDAELTQVVMAGELHC